MLLLKEEKETLKQIRDSDNKTLLTGKDKNGIPFLNHIFVLHRKIFGETCSSCPSRIGGYIQKLKTYNSNTMKKVKDKDAKFALAPDTLLVFAGTSRSYSMHNITDEVAVEYLAKNPNRKSLFSKVPDNLEKLVEAHLKVEAKAKEEVKAPVAPVIPLVPATEKIEATAAVDNIDVKKEEVVTAKVVEAKAKEEVKAPVAPVENTKQEPVKK
jgi:hypothetical protein